MHLRLATIRRGDKTYRYAQLVESFRRPEDGRPTHRVVASLGVLDDAAIANIRTALEANRAGEPSATRLTSALCGPPPPGGLRSFGALPAPRLRRHSLRVAKGDRKWLRPAGPPRAAPSARFSTTDCEARTA